MSSMYLIPPPEFQVPASYESILDSDGIYSKQTDPHVSASRLAMFRATKALIDSQTDAAASEKFSGMQRTCAWAVEKMHTIEAEHWSTHEVQLAGDRITFEQLQPDEKEVIKSTIGFLHFADGAFVDDTMQMMLTIEDNPDRQRYYVAQIDQERIHAESYELQLATLITNPAEKHELQTRVDRSSSVRDMFKYIDEITNSRHKGEAYVRIAIAEYLLFTPMFGIIHWFRHFRNQSIRGIIDLNNFIQRDEALHCAASAGFYRNSPDCLKLPRSEIVGLITRGVSLLDAFVDEYIGDIRLPKLNAATLKNYTRVIANTVFGMLGYDARTDLIYPDVEPPMDYMTFNAFGSKTNQFEARPTEYIKFNVARVNAEESDSDSADDNW